MSRISRTLTGYLFDVLFMAPSSQRLEPPGKPGRFSARRRAEFSGNQTDRIIDLL
jgi:hypothetical protein